MYHTMKARYLLVLFALLVALPQAMNAKKKKKRFLSNSILSEM